MLSLNYLPVVLLYAIYNNLMFFNLSSTNPTCKSDEVVYVAQGMFLFLINHDHSIPCHIQCETRDDDSRLANVLQEGCPSRQEGGNRNDYLRYHFKRYYGTRR